MLNNKHIFSDESERSNWLLLQIKNVHSSYKSTSRRLVREFKHLKIIISDDLLTHPQVVHDLDGLLKLYRNVHCDVVVETRANREILWQWRPVVLTPYVNKGDSE